jgi:predicted kinase
MQLHYVVFLRSIFNFESGWSYYSRCDEGATVIRATYRRDSSNGIVVLRMMTTMMMLHQSFGILSRCLAPWHKHPRIDTLRFVSTTPSSCMSKSKNSNYKNNNDNEEDGWAMVGDRNKNKKNSSGPVLPQSPSPLLLWQEAIPPTDANTQYQPFMLLLMGLPGSGKSTLALTLEHVMPYKFLRISQDQLGGSRKKCESKLRSILSSTEGPKMMPCPIIDRCNFDYSQRSKWYSIAEEYRQQQNNRYKLPIDIIVLDVPPQECLRRCQQRSRHETLSRDKAPSVIRMVQQQWKVPSSTSKQEHQKYRSCTILKSPHDVQKCIVKLFRQME